MRSWIAATLYLTTFSLFVFGQAPATPGPADVSSGKADRSDVEKVLKAYSDAYQSHDLQAVLKVWPDLQNQPKELRKTKERFENPKISNTSLSLDVEDMRPTNDGAVLKCKRVEKYDQVEFSSYSSSDNQMGSMPSQNAGPTHMESKKKVSKENHVWITLRRDGDNWKIASLTDKQPR
jgi:hypothetical protein